MFSSSWSRPQKGWLSVYREQQYYDTSLTLLFNICIKCYLTLKRGFCNSEIFHTPVFNTSLYLLIWSDCDTVIFLYKGILWCNLLLIFSWPALYRRPLNNSSWELLLTLYCSYCSEDRSGEFNVDWGFCHMTLKLLLLISSWSLDWAFGKEELRVISVTSLSFSSASHY